MTRMTLIGGDESSEIFNHVKAGNSKVLAGLIQEESFPLQELNSTDKNGRTCLSFAAANGDLCMVDLLMATNIPDANIADSEGNTPLIYAVSLGHTTITTKLLKYDSSCLNLTNRNGFTALTKAAIHGNLSCVELLIKEGADVSKTDNSRNMHALQWAKLCGSQSCIKALRKCKQGSNKKPSLTVTNNDKHAKSTSDITKISHNSTSPLTRIKESLSSHHHHKQKEYLGIESIVACVSTPTIPMLMANSGANPVSIPEPLISPRLRRALKMRPAKDIIEPTPPKIEVISDTGEYVPPTKHVYGAAPKKAQVTK